MGKKLGKNLGKKYAIKAQQILDLPIRKRKLLKRKKIVIRQPQIAQELKIKALANYVAKRSPQQNTSFAKNC